MHYYSYQIDSFAGGSGKSINPVPARSILLEPRSLVITTGIWYTEHLHGIDANYADERDNVDCDLIEDLFLRKQLEDGGTVKRGTRWSMTCRDVVRVVSGTRLLGRR